MKHYCVDNHILGWGVKRKATPGQEGMIARTMALLEDLDKQSALIIVPAPVMTEFFHRVDANEKAAAMQAFENRFIIAPFDAQAAAIADALWVKLEDDPFLCPQIASPCVIGRIPKRVLKYDVQIVAIAIAQKVDGLYSHDDHVQKIAAGRVPVMEVPKLKVQAELFTKAAPTLKMVKDQAPPPDDDDE